MTPYVDFPFQMGEKAFLCYLVNTVISVSRCQLFLINPSNFTFFLPVSKCRLKAT